MNEDPPRRIDQATIDQLRADHSLVAMVARRVKLRRSGRGWSGLCPFHQEKTASFTVTDEKGFYHCFGCGAHGDLFKWVQEVEGIGFRDAVLSLAGGHLTDARHPMPQAAQRERAQAPCDVVSSATAGRWIFTTSGPARGEIVELYLASRGLDPFAEFLPGCGAAIDGLRFHPACPVSSWRVHEEPGAGRMTAPAMIAPIADADGAVWGVHVTYLAGDGRSKAAFPPVQGKPRPTRKMFGRVAGNAVFLTPPESMCASFVLGANSQPPQSIPLIVGEGLESTWAYAQAFLKEPPTRTNQSPGLLGCRVVATLSLHNLQGGAVTLRDGSLPIWNVRADPEKPPFTLLDAGEVVVAVDADMKPLQRQKLQLERGTKPLVTDISGLQRAEICANLASQAWRRAGATPVRAVRPRMGCDFNDVVGATSEKSHDFNDSLRRVA